MPSEDKELSKETLAEIAEARRGFQAGKGLTTEELLDGLLAVRHRRDAYKKKWPNETRRVLTKEYEDV